MTTRIIAAAASHRGAVRPNNEDNLCFQGRFLPLADMDDGARWDDTGADAFRLYAVCDGMGGESAGEHASACAAQMLCEFAQSQASGPDAIARALHRINRAVYALWAEHEGRRIGCTAVLAVADGDAVRLAHVGDSRAYRLHGGHLVRMTIDHTEAARMERLGLMDGDEARRHRHNALTQHLGMRDDDVELSPDITGPLPLEAGDIWLLCSDGLSDMLADSAIERCLLDQPTPRAAADALIEQAIQSGGHDNVTVIVFTIPPEPGESPVKPDLETTLDKRPSQLSPVGGREASRQAEAVEETMESGRTSLRHRLLFFATIVLICLVAVGIAIFMRDKTALPVDSAAIHAEMETDRPTPEATAVPTNLPEVRLTPEPTASASVTQTVLAPNAQPTLAAGQTPRLTPTPTESYLPESASPTVFTPAPRLLQPTSLMDGRLCLPE